jgi:hypothetical protein
MRKVITLDFHIKGGWFFECRGPFQYYNVA